MQIKIKMIKINIFNIFFYKNDSQKIHYKSLN